MDTGNITPLYDIFEAFLKLSDRKTVKRLHQSHKDHERLQERK